MSGFGGALWVEALKARRSKVPPLTALGLSLAPLAGALFMVIMKDPERARAMGLIGQKAQLAGVADWPTYFALLAQVTAVGGAILFALVTAWVFGREFSDRTAKDLLALPTPRGAIVGAKFLVVAVWGAALVGMMFLLGLVAGNVVGMPGWSGALVLGAARDITVIAVLTLALMPPVALVASAGRGYLAPIGFAILTLVFAQILAALGWGAWFPWAVPALLSQVAGPGAAELYPASFWLVALTGLAGLTATFAWWRLADQTR